MCDAARLNIASVRAEAGRFREARNLTPKQFSLRRSARALCDHMDRIRRKEYGPAQVVPMKRVEPKVRAQPRAQRGADPKVVRRGRLEPRRRGDTANVCTSDMTYQQVRAMARGIRAARNLTSKQLALNWSRQRLCDAIQKIQSGDVQVGRKDVRKVVGGAPMKKRGAKQRLVAPAHAPDCKKSYSAFDERHGGTPILIPDINGRFWPLCCEQANKGWLYLSENFAKDWRSIISLAPRTRQFHGLQNVESEVLMHLFVNIFQSSDMCAFADRPFIHFNQAGQMQFQRHFTPKNWEKWTVKCRSRFAIFQFSMYYNPGGHRNSLLIDNETRRVRIFEPNGTCFYKFEWTQRAIRQILKTLPGNYKLHDQPCVCPYFGPQKQQEHLGQGGFCAAWTQLFMLLQMSQPDREPQDIIEEMSAKTGPELLKQIQQFVKWTEMIIPAKLGDSWRNDSFKAIDKCARQFQVVV